ncbi:MAG TPA: DUF3999 family protein [Xanthomonadaceae bacterium]|nr:DUF3999 family protein [Xanthomonadaceae bacterium]
MRRAWLLCGLLVGAAMAAGPEDFAWHWPLPLDGDEGLVTLQLDEAMYRRIQRADLRDLAAFNGDGAMIPLTPIRPPEQELLPVQPSAVPVPWFRVPQPETDGDERIELLIARGADGRLSRLHAEVSPREDTAGAEDVLIDLSMFEVPYDLIEFAFDLAPGEGLNARVDVDGSDDLSDWRRLAHGSALVDLSAGDARLQRHRVELPATSHAYLRVRRSDSQRRLPVADIAVQAIADPAGIVPPQTRQLKLSGEAEAEHEGAFLYRSDGPYPVSRVNLRLADRNSVADVVLLSRAGGDHPWRQRARLSVFQIESAGDVARSLAVRIAEVRDREWRVLTEPAQARAPTLELEYVPDRFLLLTQGDGPFMLAAGSVRGERPGYPLGTLLAELQQSRGSRWLPPEIEPGPGAALAGDAALRPIPEPLPLRRWLLWGVLVAGAGMLVVMVVGLLRQPQN